MVEYYQEIANDGVEIRAFRRSSEMASKRRNEALLLWLVTDRRMSLSICITLCQVWISRIRIDRCCGHIRISFLGLLGMQAILVSRKLSLSNLLAFPQCWLCFCFFLTLSLPPSPAGLVSSVQNTTDLSFLMARSC
jgi:hypothetical protein